MTRGVAITVAFADCGLAGTLASLVQNDQRSIDRDDGVRAGIAVSSFELLGESRFV